MALLRLEESTGPEGFPIEQELDPDNDGWFEAVPVVDFASAARERWQKENGAKADPGTRVSIHYTRDREPDEDTVQ